MSGYLYEAPPRRAALVSAFGAPPADPYGPYVPLKSGSIFADFEHVMSNFQAMFTLFCFVLFVVPAWLVFHVGSDPEVLHWITRAAKSVIALPILIVVTHVVHHFTGRPNRILILLCTVGSAALLLIVGDMILMGSYTLINQLVADDCSTFPGKAEVELEWQNAKTFYASCVSDLAANSSGNLTFQDAVVQYRIQSCPDYEQQLEANPQWPYLEQLEDRYACAGWCARGLPLWSFKEATGPCAPAVAQILNEKVAWAMLQVVVLSIAALGVLGIGLISAAPALRKYGVEM